MTLPSTGPAFWAMGLWNNLSFVIMIACAKSLSEGGTGLVFVASVLPGWLLKLSAPYWFDHVSYRSRILAATILMMVAYCSVALFTVLPPHLPGQLLGGAIVSVQCSLGEATLLALAGTVGPEALTAMASGTGLAGPAGFAYTVILGRWWSLQAVVASASVWAVAYGLVYRLYLWDLSPHAEPARFTELADLSRDEVETEETDVASSEDSCLQPHKTVRPPLSELSVADRAHLVAGLWPYMVPLVTVYAAEYACQAGAWTAIGFPVESVEARSAFYTQANWLYQAGVFVSRSSGTVLEVNMTWLWILPGIQVVNLVFFSIVAGVGGWFYREGLFWAMAFFTGLLGGAVYVHGYKRIVRDVYYKEFSLAAVSVAEGSGILVADVLGLFLQACLYDANDIPGALAKCPWH